MNVHLLIADARPLFRKALHEVFTVDVDFASITKAATGEELIKQLQGNSIDFVLAHQSLITDISLLPYNRFALITAVPDKQLFLTACEHGMCGYFTEEASEELLRSVLHATPDHPVIDPSLTVWLAKGVIHGPSGTVKIYNLQQVLSLPLIRVKKLSFEQPIPKGQPKGIKPDTSFNSLRRRLCGWNT